MATDKHLSLSEFIKNVHQQLRNDSKVIGYQKAWDKHCENTEQLERYAEAMKELAINHWDNTMSDNIKEMSRISWIFKVCLDYFWDNKLQYYRDKEQQIAEKNNIVLEYEKQMNDYRHKLLKLLDVGSCYNPFNSYTDYFDILPIDIAPAIPGVYKCDFLKVEINGYTEKEFDEVRKLECNFFHIIVFSLLLEYLPAPELRLMCCEKAYKLLKHEGLLIIITPDSKHVGANAKLMKSWQYTLAKLGFSRIQYIKLQHIHCMAFRKSISPKTSQRWAELHKDDCLYDNMYIPQDFNTLYTLPASNEKEKITYDLENFPDFIEIKELFE